MARSTEDKVSDLTESIAHLNLASSPSHDEVSPPKGRKRTRDVFFWKGVSNSEVPPNGTYGTPRADISRSSSLDMLQANKSLKLSTPPLRRKDAMRLRVLKRTFDGKMKENVATSRAPQENAKAKTSLEVTPAPVFDKLKTASFSVKGSSSGSLLQNIKAGGLIGRPFSSSPAWRVSPRVFVLQPGPYLLTMPQEIQDMILDFAYPEIKGIKYATKEEWNTREKYRRYESRAAYTPRAFPRQKVSDFMVCKKFFVAAARAYVSNQVFGDTTLGFPEVSLLSEKYGIIAQWMTSITLERLDVYYLLDWELPASVKLVTATVPECMFEDIDPKLAWEDDLDKADFKVLVAQWKVHRLSGLRDIVLHDDGNNRYANTVTKVAKWKSNIRKLENFIRPLVTRRRKREDVQRSRVAANDVTFGTRRSTSGEAGSKESEETTTTPETKHMQLRLQDLPADVDGLKARLDSDGDSVLALLNKLKAKESAGLLYILGCD
ncbi:hypothetical protein LTR37_010346 [Vermiconidia calcicola]|uniref:Uncharacterized protein n=1 Tax=Vermiconidia calcicola TaxID=1690605 RepID=A0ACC3N5G5_9PEZI|nr:hypothetical protein LTR37_010346 [Vermiconidia calcicola]